MGASDMGTELDKGTQIEPEETTQPEQSVNTAPQPPAGRVHSRRGFIGGLLGLTGLAAVGAALKTRPSEGSGDQMGLPVPTQVPGKQRTFIMDTRRDAAPVPKTAFDLLRDQTDPPVEKVTGNNNGTICLVESRTTSDAQYKVDFNDTVKDRLANMVAGASRTKGYNVADVFIVNNTSQVPPEVAFSSIEATNIGDIGKMGSYKKDGKVYLFYMPNSNIPYNDTSKMSIINFILTDKFLRTIDSGGNMDGDISGSSGYNDMKSARALQLIRP